MLSNGGGDGDGVNGFFNFIISKLIYKWYHASCKEYKNNSNFSEDKRILHLLGSSLKTCGQNVESLYCKTI